MSQGTREKCAIWTEEDLFTHELMVLRLLPRTLQNQDCQHSSIRGELCKTLFLIRSLWAVDGFLGRVSFLLKLWSQVSQTHSGSHTLEYMYSTSWTVWVIKQKERKKASWICEEYQMQAVDLGEIRMGTNGGIKAHFKQVWNFQKLLK